MAMMAPMPIPDPAVILKTVAAAFEAITAWLNYRDKRRTREAAGRAYVDAPSTPTYQDEVGRLVNVVPPDVLATMANRVDNCWKRYHVVIADDTEYLPGEIDNATEAVKKCICRELARVQALNGFVPAGNLVRY